MCAMQAKKIYQDLKASGWTPGPMAETRLRKCEAFQEFSEALGVTTDGKAGEALREDFTPALSIGDGPGNFEIRDLFENLVVDKASGEPVGRSFVQDYLDPNQPGSARLTEAMDAVDATAFLGVSGQLLVTRILQPYNFEQYTFTKMIPVYNSVLRQEKWIATTPPEDPTDDELKVEEGEELKYIGMGEQYVETPLTVERALGIALTKRAVFFNITGDLLKNANTVGDKLLYAQECEIIDSLIGAPNGQLYIEKRALDVAPVVLDAYQSSDGGNGGEHQIVNNYGSRQFGFVNEVPNNNLTDVSCIEKCDQYFSNIVDPNIGRPIVVGNPKVIACHTQRMKLMRIIEAESLYAATLGGATNATANQTGFLTRGPNTLERIGLGLDQLFTSRLLKQRLMISLGLTSNQADNFWLYGDPAQAAAYVTNWATSVTQAPLNSEAEFNQGIVLRWKASRMGTYAWQEPRCLLRNNYEQCNSAQTY